MFYCTQIADVYYTQKSDNNNNNNSNNERKMFVFVVADVVAVGLSTSFPSLCTVFQRAAERVEAVVSSVISAPGKRTRLKELAL